jgi:hypothetical protein
MQLSMLKKVAAAALATCAVPVIGALTATDVVNNIKALTAKSQAIQEPAKAVGLIDVITFPVGAGQIPVGERRHPRS